MGDIVEKEIVNFKEDFPILSQINQEKPLVYLDSSATTQKPESVISAINQYYRHDNANVHRAVYSLSERATMHYEAARQTVKNFINAKHNHEIIFTRGTTESINLVANSYGLSKIKAGDEILLTQMEHHSNIVPWQMLCEKTGAQLKVVPVLDHGELDLEAYQKLLSNRTKIVALIHASNVLGTINPVKSMIEIAHQHHIPVLLDGAQAMSHFPVDVQALDCDFYTFSSHKMYGPTGVGVLYGKERLLELMPPYQGGGDMISRVSFDRTDYNVLPHKFEAGTPNMAGVIGLAAAIDYLNQIGFSKIKAHETMLLQYAETQLAQIPGLKIIGQAKEKVAVISFVMEQAHPHDIGTVLNESGIAIRTGHHCAMPLNERFNVSATARVSFGLYNQLEDIDCLREGLFKAIELFE